MMESSDGNLRLSGETNALLRRLCSLYMVFVQAEQIVSDYSILAVGEHSPETGEAAVESLKSRRYEAIFIFERKETSFEVVAKTTS
jgi:hypothetical protein